MYSQDIDYNTYICKDCGEECDIVPESFDYAGAHCTHGRAGTHFTGDYISACCGADFLLEEELENE